MNDNILKSDYVDNVITSIDERIGEAEEILKFLREQRRQAVAFKRTNPENWYYIVKSRTGGRDHEIIRYDDGTFTCGCDAGINGRMCWARKGVEADVRDSRKRGSDGNPWYGWFNDEKAVKHYYRWSAISLAKCRS